VKAAFRARRAPLQRLVFLCALALLAAPHAGAQSGFSDPFHLAKISVSGQQKLSASAIAGASGLSVGQTVTLEEISAASKRLAEYGAFDNVNFRYVTQGDQLELMLEVVESKHLLPCRFDNFVWLSPNDLDAELRQRVPLYTGSAPASGAMLEAIQDALGEILKEHGVNAPVRAIPLTSGVGQPVGGMRFDAEGVALPIRQLSFPGASAISEEALRKQAAELLGQNYSLTDVAIFARASLIPLYGERGYLRAEFSEPVARLLDSGSAGGGGVGVTLPVREGVSYEWNGAEWAGNHVFTATDLDRLLGMRRDEVADSQKYARGIDDVNDAYSKQGYIQTVISSDPVFDDSTRRVTYRIVVQEGPQFRMGSLLIFGFPANVTKQLVKSWKIREGEVFDKAYINAFLSTELPKNLHFHPPRRVNISANLQEDPNAKKVDVQIVVK